MNVAFVVEVGFFVNFAVLMPTVRLMWHLLCVVACHGSFGTFTVSKATVQLPVNKKV